MGIFDKFKGFAKRILVRFNLISDVPDIASNTAEFFEKIKTLDPDDNESINALIALVQKGIDVDKLNSNEKTPLYEAVGIRNIKLIEMLLEAKANPNIQCVYQKTPLHWAIICNETKIIRLLLTANANPDIQCSQGRTALHWAICQKQPKIMKILLSAKANPNIRDNNGKTALYFAVRFSSVECVRALLAENADPNIQCNEGITPLVHIANQAFLILPEIISEIIRLLLDKSAIINIKDNRDRTLLSHIKYHDLEIVAKPLLKLFIDTIQCQSENDKSCALKTENQLFVEINSYIQQDNLKIKAGDVTALINWLIAKDKETKEARKKALEHIGNLYSTFQKTSSLTSYRLRDSLLGAVDDNALLFSKAAQAEPSALLTVGSAPTLRSHC